MLTRYLEIQQARFPDRMSFTVTMDEALRPVAVPILILQPLAENAVRHGIDRTGSASRVEVSAQRIDDRLELQVRNPGRLAAPVVEGIGLKNTRERLRTLYGDDASLSLTASGDHVLARLDLPFEVLP